MRMLPIFYTNKHHFVKEVEHKSILEPGIHCFFLPSQIRITSHNPHMSDIVIAFTIGIVRASFAAIKGSLLFNQKSGKR